MKRLGFLSLLAIFSLLVYPGNIPVRAASCVPEAVFVSDVTVPDGSAVQPGASFEKTWRLRNSGKCEWTAKFMLSFLEGEQLGAPASLTLGKVVAAGDQADIGVKMQAPQKAGSYSSSWTLMGEDGKAFGPKMSVRIIVNPSLEVVPTPASPATTPAVPTPAMTMPMAPNNKPHKIHHYDLYITDGYANVSSGAWPPEKDATAIPGWDKPLYIWGFSDLDPNIPENLMKVPEGAQAAKGTLVGNAKFPTPFLDVKQGDQVYLTAHNRGFFQENQMVQDEHCVHFHGIHAQTPYDGFPETAGGYEEMLRHFWQEPWYIALGSDTRTRDNKWNAMTIEQQQALLNANPPLMKKNALSPAGAIRSQFNRDTWPTGMVGLPAGMTIEDATQFTYYFEAVHPGTYMYHCHVSAAEHVHMGMYGALIIRPADYSPTNLTVYGAGTNSEYDVEYTFLLTEIDPEWHKSIESNASMGFDPADWKPRLWMINGRTFPQTLLPFAWNLPNGGSEAEPRYNTSIKVSAKQRFLVRYINMGYETHTMHQHGWHMRIVGSDGRPWKEQHEQFTLLIGSGITFDTISVADPVYGVTEPAGSPLSDRRPWRQIYPIHDHDDYEVTTNSIYPGGLATLIEAVGVPGVPANTPTWLNPYLPEPVDEPIPAPPEPAPPSTED